MKLIRSFVLTDDIVPITMSYVRGIKANGKTLDVWATEDNPMTFRAGKEPDPNSKHVNVWRHRSHGTLVRCHIYKHD